MASVADFVAGETPSFFPKEGASRVTPFSLETMASLQATFETVWRQAAQEASITKADDLRYICELVANAVLAFAEVGAQPEHIRRYALSRVRFMIASRGCTPPERP